MLVDNRIATAFAATTAAAALVTLGTATSAAADTTYPAEYFGTPKAGTGGLILRAEDGAPTNSGISEGTHFEFLGQCVRVNGVDLIEVHQSEPGGWGPSYTGYIRRQFADIPPNLPC
ncbi:hypothetical protein [Streptomyces monashensis]|uniref:SH3 domain-containing protein n=1 Tax=Streptomyces monashensis TaxID=1678012 RepID=A0A1S2QPX8_9ACTN|nr:hypothetical protein [Streptomyces monashensis]OIK08210.1 hypothetical protein BIV23_00230 [Streptomyces monashensis]